MSSLSDHVAFFLGTHGPSLTLETACSSSLVALAMAVAALRKGDCDYAIVTCVNIPQDKDFHLSLQVRTVPVPVLCSPCLACRALPALSIRESHPPPSHQTTDRLNRNHKLVIRPAAC